MFGLFRKTVDGVLRRLTRALVDLEALIEQRKGEIDRDAELVVDIEQRIDANVKEVERAHRVKQRLEALLQ